MKKVLSTVAALGLVAGLATTASAVEFKMSGNYTVEGIHLSDGAIGAVQGVDLREGVGENNTSDSWYQHTFEIKPTMKVNDKISMTGVVRFADNTVWGNQAGGDVETATATNNTVGNDIYVHQFWMEYASEIGKIRVGRHSAGPYGLDFLNTDVRQDRIMWWPSFIPKPWSVLLFTAKNTEGDLLTADQGTANDSDHYEARLNYKDEALDAGVRFALGNDNTYVTGDAQKAEKELYSGYASYKMGNYLFQTELAYYSGDKTATLDFDSFGAMLSVAGTFDALTVGGMYFYAEGDSNAADGDDNSFMNASGSGTGTEFEPLYILTGRNAGLLNRDQVGTSAYVSTATVANTTTDLNRSGVHAFILSADYKASDRLTLHGAIAYAQADEETQMNGATYVNGYANRDDEYGWEYNLGAAYKLLDNLTYEAHFGYLDTGDYFKSAAATDDTENVYILTHSLTMTF